MKLKMLELSGFKSFAKTTLLEFPSNIVGIVGPNGSGKSNIAEAIRWVLGEQSVKSLRGKRGEDLIFAGTPKAPAMGKASVTLHFDNASRRIPLNFDTVSLGRKVFRDGLNEYSINGSPVRLRDIVELLAKIGLGESKHNIIGQGEVDRILLASSRDRRAMLEDALGLRVYQLKKKEASRKLDETERNLHEIEGLVKEIAPHLKYLKSLKEKADQREVYEKELHDFQIAYFHSMLSGMKNEEAGLLGEDSPLQQAMKRVEEEIVGLQKSVDAKEETVKRFGKMQDLDVEFQALNEKRGTYERELGRLEGRLEAEEERSQKPIERIVDMPYVRGEIEKWHDAIRRLLAMEDAESMKKVLRDVDAGLLRLAGVVAKGKIIETPSVSALLGDLKKEQEKLQELLSNLEGEVERVRKELDAEEEGYQKLQQEIRGLDRAVREKEEERSGIRIKRERVRYQLEELRKDHSSTVQDMEFANISEKDIEGKNSPFSSFSSEELKRKVEKTRLRLEEIGGIDEHTIEEYHATEKRFEFLSKELLDIGTAKNDLYKLIKDLDVTIERDFEEGFKKVQNEFQNYFKIIFGGGKAILKHQEVKLELDEYGEPIEPKEDEGEKSFGIEIEVDLPRKRIKGMAMLSGGERALTAIALLFAISAVNPPPFLVLDETDAALDEANSKLYADTLKQLSEKTDLVIVTHNRETMKQAGILYGVTMGDDGISKLLSLKFEEAREYANR